MAARYSHVGPLCRFRRRRPLERGDVPRLSLPLVGWVAVQGPGGVGSTGYDVMFRSFAEEVV